MVDRELTAGAVRNLFLYEPDTGLLSWKPRTDVAAKWRERWNARYAGLPVGTPTKGYLVVRIYKRHYPAHRLIWLYMTGEWPANEIDHINGIRDDNRWSNLRIATKQQQQWNTTRRSDNVSGFKWVRLHKPSNKWIAQIKIDGESRHLGMFATQQEAHAAAIAEAQRERGQFFRT